MTKGDKMEAQIYYDKQKVMNVCKRCNLEELYQIPSENKELVIFIVPYEKADCNKKIVEHLMQEATSPLNCCTTFTQMPIAEGYKIISDGDWIV